MAGPDQLRVVMHVRVPVRVPVLVPVIAVIMTVLVIMTVSVSMLVPVGVSMKVRLLVFRRRLHIAPRAPEHPEREAGDEHGRDDLEVGLRRLRVPVAAVLQRRRRQHPDEERVRDRRREPEQHRLRRPFHGSR